MGALDSGGGGRRPRGNRMATRMKRPGLRLDMTPMVDVAFLLLTFFMLTTVFTKPQTMELCMPPSVNVPVPESHLLTLRMLPDRSIYWNIGSDKPKRIEFAELRAFLAARLKVTPQLITLLKIHRDGSYCNAVDLIDELNGAHITRFSLEPWKEADTRTITGNRI